MRKFYIFCSIFLFSSCSVIIPDHKIVQLTNMNTKSAQYEINLYNNKVLQETNILSNITFRFKGRTMTALGITKIDEKNQAYKVAALNPMGVTLFQLEVKNNEMVSSYIIPQFTPGKKDNKADDKADKAATMISKDIAHIYFNRTVDTTENFLKLNEYKITINTKSENNQYFKYVFIGEPLKLATKVKYENNKKLWSVDYYNYQKAGIKEMPFKIIFQNHKYGYMLEIDTKKIDNY